VCGSSPNSVPAAIARALNEVLSTMFYVFAGIGVFAYACAVAIAIALSPHIFNLDPGQLQDRPPRVPHDTRCSGRRLLLRHLRRG
jgi:hypothetical protein